MVKSIKLVLAVCVLSALAAVRANAQANTPPQLSPQQDKDMPELTTLMVTNTATDQDVPAQKLTYQLLNPPTGAAIDTNGIISWTPSEAQGPASYLITTIVTDNGTPPLSATNSFALTVTEVNSAPHLAVIPDQIVVETNTVFLSNAATDTDIPANTLTYMLVNPPVGASIDASGQISYTPPPTLTPATYTITTVVTDNGQPPLSDTNSFSLTIAASRTNLTLNLKIALTAYTQNTVVLDTNNPPRVLLTARPAKITTTDCIAAIGSDIGHGSNVFPASAKLLFQFGNIGTANHGNTFLVRNGTHDTDVSQYLQISSPGQSVITSRTNNNKGTVSDTSYEILELKLLNNGKGTFDVQGFSIVPGMTLVNKGRVINSERFPTAIMANVAGNGHIGSAVAVFKGTITASGAAVETKPVTVP